MGGSRNYRQAVGGLGHTDKKNDFLSLSIVQRGPISGETKLFEVLEGAGGGGGGGGVNFIQGRSNFFLEGVGSVCLFQWKPVLVRKCNKQLRVYVS